jgi:hypothetical protein
MDGYQVNRGRIHWFQNYLNINGKIAKAWMTMFIVYCDVSVFYAALIKKYAAQVNKKKRDIRLRIIRITTTHKTFYNEREKGKQVQIETHTRSELNLQGLNEETE